MFHLVLIYFAAPSIFPQIQGPISSLEWHFLVDRVTLSCSAPHCPCCHHLLLGTWRMGRLDANMLHLLSPQLVSRHTNDKGRERPLIGTVNKYIKILFNMYSICWKEHLE